jgi:hypothetical protein
MKKKTMKTVNLLLVFTAIFLILGSVNSGYAQKIRWLRVSDLQTPVNEIGAEYEGEFTAGNTDFLTWPALYGIDQYNNRCNTLWIGCHNFDDPVEGKVKSVKVVGVNARDHADRPNQVFEQELKLIGKYPHPSVIVDDQPGTVLDTYDLLDERDPNMKADRMVLVRINTSVGVSVTKKVMVFANSDHGNYTINDYVFKNTGIYNRAGVVKQQTLHEVYFYFSPRYSMAGVSCTGYGLGWGAWSATWGNSQIIRSFGEDPSAPEYSDPLSPYYQMRGFYDWYGPNKDRPVSYNEDWGCPNQREDGTLASAKFAGHLTLHADKSPSDPSDDPFQPHTTWYISADIAIFQANTTQYDEIFMADRYRAMSEGHPGPNQQHYMVVDDTYPIDYVDPWRQTGGGVQESQGYGPYEMDPDDSIHIVFAEGVSGISWEKGREVGANWLEYYNQTGTPTLTMPDNSTTTDYNAYKKAWCMTGVDSILKTFRAAKNNYENQYDILPQPPEPPSSFTVTSGGDRIRLSWDGGSSSAPNFGGYVVYRSRGNVLDWHTVYEKIYETNEAVTGFDDITAIRGFEYYYYIQTKNNDPSHPLYSSPFWTITNVPATLQRPAGDYLEEVRVVPNPYDIRARKIQFGDKSQYDQIAFYGIPPVCKLKIFTERGDLIWEKDHTIGTGDERWNSTTTYGQIVTSGIYILYVEVTQDTYATEDQYARYDVYDSNLKLMYHTGDLMYSQGQKMFSKGESTYRKFVIIR